MTIILSFVTFALIIMWLTAVSNFFFFPQLKAKTPPERPLISILIPARNESAIITQTVQAILAQTYSQFELFILDDQSDDDTAEHVQTFARIDNRVMLLNGRPLPDGWLGKNWACHQLAQQANGRFLLFLDADVQLNHQALDALVAMQIKTNADLLTVWPTQLTQSWGERLVVPQMALAILAYLPVLPVHHTNLPAFAAANGQCLLFTQNGYAQCGEHTAVRTEVVEDVALARHIKVAKMNLRMANGNRLIQCRMYHSWREVKDGFAKNILAGHANSILFLFLSTLFHWAIFILPGIWFLLTGNLWAFGLFLASIGLRMATAVFTHQRPQDAFLQPLSVWLMTRIAWQSVRWQKQGTAVWKGRKIG